MKYILIAILLLAGAGCNQDRPDVPVSPTWQAMYSVGVKGCDDFDFGEPHYCVKTIPWGTRLGQSITMRFTVSGDLHPTEGGSLEPRLRLFLWRAGDNMTCAGVYQGYRYFSRESAILSPGTHEMTVTLDAANWSDCYGQSIPDQFAGTVNNLQLLGYTFGGDFAGHGVRGTGHFHLDAYDIH